jgi:hypothetical protein
MASRSALPWPDDRTLTAPTRFAVSPGNFGPDHAGAPTVETTAGNLTALPPYVNAVIVVETTSHRRVAYDQSPSPCSAPRPRLEKTSMKKTPYPDHRPSQ